MQHQANILSFDEARRAVAGSHAAASRAGGRRGAHGAGEATQSNAPGTRSAGRHSAPVSRKTEHATVAAEDESVVMRKTASRKARSRIATNRNGTPETSAERPKPSWYTDSAPEGRAAARNADDVFLKEEPPARQSRFADDDSFDADLEEQLEEALEKKKKGPFASLRANAAKSKHDRVKEKAGRAFAKQYEGAGESEGAQSGPRAAVYKGEMGASHKRSARMQNSATSSSASSPRHGARGVEAVEAKSTSPVRSALRKMGFAGVALLLTAAFLYGPAQQLYADIRQRDRLAAEYEMVTARNNAISEHVEALQTEDGVEDVARAELGWVREGEHAVNVSNLNLDDHSDFQGNIVSEDVPYPRTWYSAFLDPLFGVG